MHALFIPLIGLLAKACGALVGRVLLALGFSYVTYQGFNFAADFIVQNMKSSMGSMPAEVLNILGYLWVDRALSMVVSAYSAALAVKGMTSSLTKLVLKK